MFLNQYQRRALRTDHTGRDLGTNISREVVVGLLGLAGEAGTLATAYKKFMRDGPAYELYREHVREELGDILWYLALLAQKFNLTLEEVAAANLSKANDRWMVNDHVQQPAHFLDSRFPSHEQLPRTFRVRFIQKRVDGQRRVELWRRRKVIGDSLTDNAYYDDGYRFHDAFHLAYAACLGWSPVTRKLFGCKRRSHRLTDEIEDGGRATVIEEGIAAYVFSYASKHKLLKSVSRLDFEVLKTIRTMAALLEVHERTWNEWETAVLQGYEVFRMLNRYRGGVVEGDLLHRRLRYYRF